MSNKLDFYKFLYPKETESKDGRAQLTDRELKVFQAAHPGFYWRKCGKASYQIQFNRKEGWQSTESFTGNFKSRLCQNLKNQIDVMKVIYTSYGLLSIIDFGEPVSVENLIKVGLLRKESLDGYIADQANAVVAKTKAPLEEKIRELQNQLSEIRTSRDAFHEDCARYSKEILYWRNLLKDTCKYLTERNSGFGVTKDQVKSLVSQIQNYLSEH